MFSPWGEDETVVDVRALRHHFEGEGAIRSVKQDKPKRKKKQELVRRNTSPDLRPTKGRKERIVMEQDTGLSWQSIQDAAERAQSGDQQARKAEEEKASPSMHGSVREQGSFLSVQEGDVADEVDNSRSSETHVLKNFTLNIATREPHNHEDIPVVQPWRRMGAKGTPGVLRKGILQRKRMEEDRMMKEQRIADISQKSALMLSLISRKRNIVREIPEAIVGENFKSMARSGFIYDKNKEEDKDKEERDREMMKALNKQRSIEEAKFQDQRSRDAPSYTEAEKEKAREEKVLRAMVVEGVEEIDCDADPNHSHLKHHKTLSRFFDRSSLTRHGRSWDADRFDISGYIQSISLEAAGEEDVPPPALKHAATTRSNRRRQVKEAADLFQVKAGARQDLESASLRAKMRKKEQLKGSEQEEEEEEEEKPPPRQERLLVRRLSRTWEPPVVRIVDLSGEQEANSPLASLLSPSWRKRETLEEEEDEEDEQVFPLPSSSHQSHSDSKLAMRRFSRQVDLGSELEQFRPLGVRRGMASLYCWDSVHKEGVSALRVHGEGGEGKLISGSYDCRFCVIDLEEGVCEETYKSSDSPIHSLHVDDHVVYVGNERGSILLQDLRMKQESRRQLAGHRGAVYCLDKHQDFLYSGGHDCALRMHDLRMNKCIRKFRFHNLPVDDHAVISASWDGYISYFKEEGEHKRLMDVRRPASPVVDLDGVLSLAYRDGLLYSGSHDQTIRIWDARSFDESTRLEKLPSHLQQLLPSSQLERVPSLEEGHEWKMGGLGSSFIHPGIGLRLGDDMHPPAVAEIFPGSACEFSGIKIGDVITGVNGVSIETAKDLSRQIAEAPEHDAVDFSFLRHGSDENLQEMNARIVPTIEEKDETSEQTSFTDARQLMYALVDILEGKENVWDQVNDVHKIIFDHTEMFDKIMIKYSDVECTYLRLRDLWLLLHRCKLVKPHRSLADMDRTMWLPRIRQLYPLPRVHRLKSKLTANDLLQGLVRLANVKYSKQRDLAARLRRLIEKRIQPHALAEVTSLYEGTGLGQLEQGMPPHQERMVMRSFGRFCKDPTRGLQVQEFAEAVKVEQSTAVVVVVTDGSVQVLNVKGPVPSGTLYLYLLLMTLCADLASKVFRKCKCFFLCRQLEELEETAGKTAIDTDAELVPDEFWIGLALISVDQVNRVSLQDAMINVVDKYMSDVT
ncbi:hypothetical protein GUITHDRAFT_144566 [Guillardia theta CCMP2712]|uniref:PDZ domain-containing protein n=1 Tax=Guillardia theta (strain CCMP2712) TaxID=905079 RepID=L1IP58_GUITC|nr:hypothetical protein GUITHDRAFT_144566 [Guillardia theta CCMP2712]EKX38076.1 hypothetical protein GUITHDRAFT_144566 [Guillardia theta CCMP2712]|eukprot:XP_005825056.1 hypothetical protein GUITHDRAFT_144566 [Guillardia theta CCMP2712]